MTRRSAAITDIGLKRKTNQDAFFKEDSLGLYIVADGMGGHLGGEVASQLAIDVVVRFCQEQTKMGPRELLSRAVNKASEEIFKKAAATPELAGMGTTVITLLYRDGAVYVGQVGDSRAYLVRPEGQWQLTEDHSLLNEEIRAGRLNPDEASQFQFRNVITRSVGYEDHVLVDVYRRELGSGDILVACTDGLCGLVGLQEIGNEIRTNGVEKGTANLVELAKQRGGDDNITVIAVE